MNEDIKSIGIYPENCQFESDYLPLISFKTKQQKDIAEQYILTKARVFFREIIKIEIDVEKSQIIYPKMITETDFKIKSVSYFYENIFFDLGQRDADKKSGFFPKWGITFDEKCAPIKVMYLSRNYPFDPNSTNQPKLKFFQYSHRTYEFSYRYGTLELNKQPIFYYIYFTLQEILDEIRRNTEAKTRYYH